MSINTKWLCAIGLGFMLPCVALAGSVVPNADFTFGVQGNILYSPGSPSDLNSANSITIPNVNDGNPLDYRGLQIQGLPLSYLLLPNDFCNPTDCGYSGHTPLIINQNASLTGTTGYTLDVTGTYTSGDFAMQFTMPNAPNDVMTFTGVTRQVTSSVNSQTQAESLTLYYLGTFTDSLGVYVSSSPASVVFGFTQTGGATGGVAGSGVFATPPQSFVPEPASMVLLGSALLGLGLVTRRRKVKA